MITAGQLSLMRATVERTFVSSCSIVRNTRTDTDEGSWTTAETTVATGVMCRYAPLGSGGGAERIIAERMAAVADTVINMPVGTDVTPRDRVVIGSRTFEVKDVMDDRSQPTHLRVYAQEMT